MSDADENKPKKPSFKLEALVAAPNFKPRVWQSAAPDTSWTQKLPVAASPDLARILALPLREPPEPRSVQGEALIELMTRRLAKPVTGRCRCKELNAKRGQEGRECITRLRFIQAWTLYEAGLVGGILGLIPVGAGKTLVDILAPLVIRDCKTALLLVPPNLVDQLIGDYEIVAQHFRVPTIVVHGRSYHQVVPGMPALHVLPYSRLSRPESTAFLEHNLRPDVVIADEADRLRHADTAGTSRVLRYFADHGETRFLGWSGSLTDQSIKEFAHLSALALRFASPVPLDKEAIEDWSRALDAGPDPAPGGALMQLCEEGEEVRQGFHRRFISTAGVITSRESPLDAELVIEEQQAPPVPNTPCPDPRAPGGHWDGVADALGKLRDTWSRPDGEIFVDAMQVARCARELACGFFYRWKFPRGEPRALIEEWLEARKEWHKELREKLRTRAEHMDSELLCTRAARRAWGDDPLTRADSYEEEFLDEYGTVSRRVVKAEHGKLPTWKAFSWPRWRDVRAQVKPESEAVRLDPYLARDAAGWAHSNLGIVWYESQAFGLWIAELAGLTMHGGGPGAGKRILEHDGRTSIVASIKSHGRGRDGLQYKYADQLVAQPLSSATGWEQLLGRLHRPGQRSPVVRARFYRHTEETRAQVDKALSRALYVEQAMGAVQKLRMGFRLEGLSS